MELSLTKAVVVNGKDKLNKQFEENYFPEIDMYIFFSTILFDTNTGSYSGRRLMHDQIESLYKIPTKSINSKDINYIVVDITHKDRKHTYFKANRRMYNLSDRQRDYLKNMFDADF